MLMSTGKYLLIIKKFLILLNINIQYKDPRSQRLFQGSLKIREDFESELIYAVIDKK